MAIVTTPLLSFTASGQVAKSLVYYSWKTLDVVRSYVVPTDPQTAPQLAQRGLFGDAVDAWGTYFTNEDGRDDWARYAGRHKDPLSPFNAFQSSAMLAGATLPSASFELESNAISQLAISFTMRRLDTGGLPTELTDFEFYAGPSPDALVFQGLRDLVAGEFLFSNNLGPDGATWYAQAFKNGIPRTGIAKEVLTVG